MCGLGFGSLTCRLSTSGVSRRSLVSEFQVVVTGWCPRLLPEGFEVGGKKGLSTASSLTGCTEGPQPLVRTQTSEFGLSCNVVLKRCVEGAFALDQTKTHLFIFVNAECGGCFPWCLEDHIPVGWLQAFAAAS